jgi:2'-5' RNA ligase
MQCCAADGKPINLYALVYYIPGPLGVFLDQLRSELVPDCRARAHVTVLPPRELNVEPGVALRALHESLQIVLPFTLELTDVETFDLTSVIYLGVGAGQKELLKLHEALNTTLLASGEVHKYHPHLTLAQDLTPDQLPALKEKARRRLAEFRGTRRFEVDALTFVQNTDSKCWIDLEEIPLAEPVGSRRR